MTRVKKFYLRDFFMSFLFKIYSIFRALVANNIHHVNLSWDEKQLSDAVEIISEEDEKGDVR